MLSIVTVNWNSYEYLNLLLESIERFTYYNYEIVVVDNSDKDLQQPIKAKNTHQLPQTSNIGHGAGLNLGVNFALNEFPQNPFVVLLDCDTHFVLHEWDRYLTSLCDQYDVIGGKGSIPKPIRPAFLMLHAEIAAQDWTATPGYKGHRITPEGYDVAISAYHKLVAEGKRMKLLEPIKNQYGTLNGELYCVHNEPFIYHHWSGTWSHIRQADFPNDDLEADKRLMFSKIPWRMI